MLKSRIKSPHNIKIPKKLLYTKENIINKIPVLIYHSDKEDIFIDALDEAENYLLNSLKIRKMLEDKLNIAVILGNISLVKLNEMDSCGLLQRF